MRIISRRIMMRMGRRRMMMTRIMIIGITRLTRIKRKKKKSEKTKKTKNRE